MFLDMTVVLCQQMIPVNSGLPSMNTNMFWQEHISKHDIVLKATVTYHTSFINLMVNRLKDLSTKQK